MNPLDFDKKLQKARLCMQSGNHADALKAYGALLKQFPQSGLWDEYGSAATVACDFELAAQIWEKMRLRGPKTAGLLLKLAREYQGLRLHAKARPLYAEAEKLEPGNLEGQLALAWLLARTGGVTEAREAVSRCVSLDPRDEQARFLSAQLDRREGKFESAEKQFRDLNTSGPKHPYVAFACHSELANILDRTGRFEEAMTELQTGKKLAGKSAADKETERKSIDVWHERILSETKSLPKNILATWRRERSAASHEKAASLAFLTGSARSGTTLLERILDAHPMVAASDEALAYQTLNPLTETNAVTTASAAQVDELGSRYLRNLMLVSDKSAQGKLLLDKNPSHTAYLPALLRTFPEMRLLIALRDPRDVLVSLYFQNQANTNHLSFELLGQYYRNVMDMWLVVREWEGLAWTETRYEDVVADLRKEGERVTRFLRLEWNEDQAQFHEKNRERPVMSTNYTDVTQPVYKRSVGRWQAYEKHLSAALPLLEPYCRRFGYS